MTKILAALSATKVLHAKPREKLYKLTDGDGLALWVYPSGVKRWRLSYSRSDGKKDSISLGRYPDFSLVEARAWRTEMRAKIARGIDVRERAEEERPVMCFPELVELWYERWCETVTPSYAAQVKRAIEANTYPILEAKNILLIKPTDIVAALTPMEARGKLEYLRRTKQGLRQIFEFGISRGLLTVNPVASIGNSAFKTPKRRHFEALTPKQLPELIRFVESDQLEPVTRLAIYWQLLTLSRPTEAAKVPWAEIDFDKGLWVIDAKRMKTGRSHWVPLTTHMLWILNEAKALGVHSEYVFTGRDLKGPINRETIRIALRRGGLATTAHGLRALASTYLNESGLFRSDVIEASLAHTNGSSVRAAYNRALYLDERREMLEWWGNDVFKIVADVGGL